MKAAVLPVGSETCLKIGASPEFPGLLPGGFFLYSPAKNRFLNRQYQGFPDRTLLKTGLSSLRNSPAIPLP
jgi:hypothetical protein